MSGTASIAVGILMIFLSLLDEDNQMVEIIKSIQQYEVDISKSEYAARKKSRRRKRCNSGKGFN